MKVAGRLILFFAVLFLGIKCQGQYMEEDTTTNQPFFKASRFSSACNVGAEAQVTQILSTKAGMNVGFNLNWVVNHKFVVSAKYQVLTTQNNVQKFVEPGVSDSIPLSQNFVGLGFSYILFSNKLFSFQPEITGGWCPAKFSGQQHNFGAIIPAVYGIYNATRYFRLGVGLSYRAVIGPSASGLTGMDLSGVAGVVFFRVGTF